MDLPVRRRWVVRSYNKIPHAKSNPSPLISIKLLMPTTNNKKLLLFWCEQYNTFFIIISLYYFLFSLLTRFVLKITLYMAVLLI
jgi:hypothetical protein